MKKTKQGKNMHLVGATRYDCDKSKKVFHSLADMQFPWYS